MTNHTFSQKQMNDWYSGYTRSKPVHQITYVPQKPLHNRIVERVTLPVYLGLAGGAGILIGRFW